MLLLLLQVRAMYDAYKSPAVSLDAKQLLAWDMIMVRLPAAAMMMSSRTRSSHAWHMPLLQTVQVKRQLCRCAVVITVAGLVCTRVLVPHSSFAPQRA